MKITFTKDELIILRACMHSVTIKGTDARVFGLLLDKLERGLETFTEEKEIPNAAKAREDGVKK